MALLFFGASLAFCAALAISPPDQAGAITGTLVVTVHRGAAAGLALLSLLMLVVSTQHSFHAALGMHLGLSVLLMVLFQQPPGNLFLLLVVGLLPLCIYERFPLNLWLAGAYAAIVVIISAAVNGQAVSSILPLGLVGAIVALTGSLMGRHWETVIELQDYITRLEDNVASLTRANSLSQDYARGVEEESRVAERMRLTRDIHDSIGYTMTNTIMAMEAVKMMVKTEPERVGGYLEITREHAEEGFAHIRKILRDFRGQQQTEDTCFAAIKKLVKVVTLSTGLSIRFEFGNLEVTALDPFAEAVYHFVQEGLINAFRHGHARHVMLLFWDFGGSIRVTLDDDGTGCGGPPTPGIGINGMLERAAALGGRVGVERYARGFRISMILPRVTHAAAT
jgi:signal transduction histidine kinase